MKLNFFFFYSLALFFLLPRLLPDLRLFYLAPFLIICFYNQSKLKCLWLSLICGFIIDLFSAQTRLGFYACNYVLTTWILYGQKQNYYEDSPTTFPIMTFYFAVLSTSIFSMMMMILGTKPIFSIEFFKNDLIFMPFYDAIYCGICFTFPYLFFPNSPKIRKVLYTNSRIR